MPSIDGRISLGNILTLVAMVGGLATVWGTTRSTVDDLQSRVKALEPKVQQLETAQAVTSSKLTTIKDGIDELKRTQGETNTLIRTLLQNQR